MSVGPLVLQLKSIRFLHDSIHVRQDHFGIVDAKLLPCLKEVVAQFELPKRKLKAVLTARESSRKRFRAQLLPEKPPGYWGHERAQSDYRLFDSWRATR